MKYKIGDVYGFKRTRKSGSLKVTTTLVPLFVCPDCGKTHDHDGEMCDGCELKLRKDLEKHFKIVPLV